MKIYFMIFTLLIALLLFGCDNSSKEDNENMDSSTLASNVTSSQVNHSSSQISRYEELSHSNSLLNQPSSSSVEVSTPNNQESSAAPTPKPAEAVDSIPNVATLEPTESNVSSDEIVQQQAAFQHYLLETLPADKRGSIGFSDTGLLVVWVSDEEALQEAIDNYSGDIPGVEYKSTDYSYAQLNTICKDISNLKSIKENEDDIMVIGPDVAQNRVRVRLTKSISDIVEEIEQQNYAGIVDIDVTSNKVPNT